MSGNEKLGEKDTEEEEDFERVWRRRGKQGLQVWEKMWPIKISTEVLDKY